MIITQRAQYLRGEWRLMSAPDAWDGAMPALLMHDILEHPFDPHGTALEEFWAIGALLYIRLPTWDAPTRESWASGLAEDLLKTLVLHYEGGATLRRRHNSTLLNDPQAEQFIALLELTWGHKCGSALPVYRANEAVAFMSAGQFPAVTGPPQRCQVARDFFRERIAPVLRAGYRYARHRYAGCKRELLGKAFTRGVNALAAAADLFARESGGYGARGDFEIIINLKHAQVRVKELYGRS